MYDTRRAEGAVKFGLATHEEMCFNFLWVYPKENLNSVKLCGTIYKGVHKLDYCEYENKEFDYALFNSTKQMEQGGHLSEELQLDFSQVMDESECVLPLSYEIDEMNRGGVRTVVIVGAGAAGVVVVAAMAAIAVMLGRRQSGGAHGKGAAAAGVKESAVADVHDPC